MKRGHVNTILMGSLILVSIYVQAGDQCESLFSGLVLVSSSKSIQNEAQAKFKPELAASRSAQNIKLEKDLAEVLKAKYSKNEKDNDAKIIMGSPALKKAFMEHLLNRKENFKDEIMVAHFSMSRSYELQLMLRVDPSSAAKLFIMYLDKNFGPIYNNKTAYDAGNIRYELSKYASEILANPDLNPKAFVQLFKFIARDAELLGMARIDGHYIKSLILQITKLSKSDLDGVSEDFIDLLTAEGRNLINSEISKMESYDNISNLDKTPYAHSKSWVLAIELSFRMLRLTEAAKDTDMIVQFKHLTEQLYNSTFAHIYRYDLSPDLRKYIIDELK